MLKKLIQRCSPTVLKLNKSRSFLVLLPKKHFSQFLPIALSALLRTHIATDSHACVSAPKALCAGSLAPIPSARLVAQSRALRVIALTTTCFATWFAGLSASAHIEFNFLNSTALITFSKAICLHRNLSSKIC